MDNRDMTFASALEQAKAQRYIDDRPTAVRLAMAITQFYQGWIGYGGPDDTENNAITSVVADLRVFMLERGLTMSDDLAREHGVMAAQYYLTLVSGGLAHGVALGELRAMRQTLLNNIMETIEARDKQIAEMERNVRPVDSD